MADPDEELGTAVQTSDVRCGCPCGHDVLIEVRMGFILCTLGKEKLCSDCVMPLGAAFQCHKGHEEPG